MASDAASSVPVGYAFFDFDNTILHGDAGPLFGKHLLREESQRLRQRRPGPKRAVQRARFWTGVLTFGAWMSAQSALYKLRAVRRSTIVRSAYRGLKNVPAEWFMGQMGDFAESNLKPRFYPEVLQEMQEHEAAGRTCVIVTTGMEVLVEHCLKWLPENTQLIGCSLEIDGDRITGNVTQGPLYGQDKANIILAYCKATGVDPADCWAYTDHYSDYQMLEAVGTAVCVNPRTRLMRMAKTRNWRILSCQDPTE